jgi:hypothetical protein
MIARARLIFGSLPREAPGRPRMYKNSKEADHAFYMRHRDRFRKMREISPKNGHPMKDMAVVIAETIVAAVPDTGARVLSLKEVLVNAAGGNVDREADVLTIRRLLDRGCDLEADVLPTVARMVPELPRPLKNWGAQWLVREILAARDRRAVARVRDLCLDRSLSLDEPPRVRGLIVRGNRPHFPAIPLAYIERVICQRGRDDPRIQTIDKGDSNDAVRDGVPIPPTVL